MRLNHIILSTYSPSPSPSPSPPPPLPPTPPPTHSLKLLIQLPGELQVSLLLWHQLQTLPSKPCLFRHQVGPTPQLLVEAELAKEDTAGLPQVVLEQLQLVSLLHP